MPETPDLQLKVLFEDRVSAFSCTSAFFAFLFPSYKAFSLMLLRFFLLLIIKYEGDGIGNVRREVIDIYNHIDKKELKESYMAHIRS